MICMYEDQCDFYVLWNGQCCFGNFDSEGPQFTTDAVSQTGVYFKQGNEEISIPNYFETKNGKNKNQRRFVEFADTSKWFPAQGKKIAPAWQGWMHYQYDDPPKVSKPSILD